MVEAKIAKLLGPRELIFESEHIDENALGSDEVLCKTLATAISPGTEIAAYNGSPPLRPVKVYPRVVGYCNVAEIINTGSNVNEYEIGHRVLTFSSHRSHFIAKTQEILAIVPDEVPSNLASTTYIYHLGYNAILNANIKYGSPVLVIGLGVIGLCTVALANLAGGKVFAVTDHALPAQKAIELGAIEVFSRKDSPSLKLSLGNRLADAVITTSNSWYDWELALESAGLNGKICVLGFPGRGSEEIPLNPLDSRYFYHKQLQLHAVGSSPENNDSRQFLKFNEKDNLQFLIEEIEKKNIDPNIIITGEEIWSDLNSIYERLSSRENSPLTYILNWEN